MTLSIAGALASWLLSRDAYERVFSALDGAVIDGAQRRKHTKADSGEDSSEQGEFGKRVDREHEPYDRESAEEDGPVNQRSPRRLRGVQLLSFFVFSHHTGSLVAAAWIGRL